MRGEAAISPIYKRGPDQLSPDPFSEFSRIERLRRQAWLRHGIVSLQLAELPEPLRSLLSDHMEQAHGAR